MRRPKRRRRREFTELERLWIRQLVSRHASASQIVRLLRTDPRTLRRELAP